jgi:D-alanine-D-alanine ligase
LIFGGRSAEHEVSVVSAEHVIAAVEHERFEVVPIGVTRQGVWLSPAETHVSLSKADLAFKKSLVGGSHPVAPSLAEGLRALQDVDVVFPLIHGTHGEDGTLQGMFELAGIPYVGCGVAASAIGMDKALMKSVFRANGLPVADCAVIDLQQWNADPVEGVRALEDKISYPAFIKPANGGSSVGVSKVHGREDAILAVAEAGRYDRKILVEEAIDGREVECGILGNADAKASPVGEIKYTRDFYDFEAKYLDATTEILAPADLPSEVGQRVQEMALRAFHAIDGAGLARVDFFLLPDGSLIIDEINTLPGFTPASMYPRLWQEAGVSYSNLVSRLVDFALARHREKPIV